MPVIEFIEDVAVDAMLDWQLRELLSLCFTKPCDIVFRDRRYFHESPRWRWFVPGNSLIAHVAVHDKIIGTTAGDVRVAGIAEVCVHPAHRGHGWVRQLLATAHPWLAAQGIPFAMLFGNSQVYSSSGYRNVADSLRYFDGATQTWQNKSFDCAMVQPLGAQEWPAGPVDLRGPTF